jgi:hypothetical protein
MHAYSQNHVHLDRDVLVMLVVLEDALRQSGRLFEDGGLNFPEDIKTFYSKVESACACDSLGALQKQKKRKPSAPATAAATSSSAGDKKQKRIAPEATTATSSGLSHGPSMMTATSSAATSPSSMASWLRTVEQALWYGLVCYSSPYKNCTNVCSNALDYSSSSTVPFRNAYSPIAGTAQSAPASVSSSSSS